MPRRSVRNVITALRALALDVKGKGPDASENIQLTYQLDDVSHQLSQEYGVGYSSGQLGGDFHRIVQLEITNPGGILITECGELVFGTVTRSLAWTDVVSETITTTVTSTTHPALGFGFPRPPRTLIQTGFMPGAAVRDARAGDPVDGQAFLWFANNTMRDFFVPGPTAGGRRFFMFVGSQSVGGATMGVRWREFLVT